MLKYKPGLLFYFLSGSQDPASYRVIMTLKSSRKSILATSVEAAPYHSEYNYTHKATPAHAW